MGMLEAEQQMWVANQKRDLLELRHRQIHARVDLLNQLNTQAMLVAGSAVASLGGESLETIDAVWATATVLDFIFVASTAATLCFSLWVIFISSNLIMLSQMTALTGHSAYDVKTADEILERRINQVRSFYLLALVTLLVSALSMVWMNCTHWNSLISTVIFAVVVVHAVHTLRETSAEFQRSTSFDGGDDTHLLQCINSAWPPGCCRRRDAQRARSVRFHGRRERVASGRSRAGRPEGSSAGRREAYGGWVLKSKPHAGPLRSKVRPSAIDLFRAAIAASRPIGQPSDRSARHAAAEPRADGGEEHAARSAHPPFLPPAGPLHDRCWLVLRDTTLAWYNSEDEHTLQTPPKEVVSLQGYIVRETMEPEPSCGAALIVMPRSALAAATSAVTTDQAAALAPKSWYMRAETDEETRRWRDMLNVAIRQAARPALGQSGADAQRGPGGVIGGALL
ncbi:hypothetical protein EMIHUDRAFT_448361 [Emiliania huxleyi CCMP1516]|uniref:PH domain-containing protein n=2 Tax=Emiliania huxleyi TaxID=2903 RepID=A0A0D3IDV5_EMIH1|nr:hypothetical protein EMIHUDRAFT_448361 [Emiliania huxleyi CCMP1516]EOD09440.1 hypothetical protein EMIHUDRAFT_448361 [Emiliania huxleyi CCMP1516]|eukprot:XP_005761869.1 hypothetical protein EMIHUDRAFT_448361 [Emiliania huxleyi CCMP1516]